VAPGLPAAELPRAQLTVVWANPSSRFTVACGGELFDGRQHHLRGASGGGPLTERFIVRSGNGQVQCFLAEHGATPSRWAIFTDAFSCLPGANVRLDMRLDELPDGRLVFDAAYSGDRCQSLPDRAKVGRREVERRSERPPAICCPDRGHEPPIGD
jgi:hypothetical protein